MPYCRSHHQAISQGHCTAPPPHPAAASNHPPSMNGFFLYVCFSPSQLSSDPVCAFFCLRNHRHCKVCRYGHITRSRRMRMMMMMRSRARHNPVACSLYPSIHRPSVHDRVGVEQNPPDNHSGSSMYMYIRDPKALFTTTTTATHLSSSLSTFTRPCQ